jgi:hypothetical protein
MTESQKTIYLLNIGDYAPEICELTYPTIYAYAAKCGAGITEIRERKFHEWPLTYEKLQIGTLAREAGDDWAIYIDSDTLVHPELPDITELVPSDHVCHNAVDFAPIRWRYDKYFRRDGRNIGSANWFAAASEWCFDLWTPIHDMTPEEAIGRITLSAAERRLMKPEHLIDDYALSRNIARFGLKCITMTDLWRRANLPIAEFFFHQYLMPIEDYEGRDEQTGEIVPKLGKLNSMKQTLERWQVDL